MNLTPTATLRAAMDMDMDMDVGMDVDVDEEVAMAVDVGDDKVRVVMASPASCASGRSGPRCAMKCLPLRT